MFVLVTLLVQNLLISLKRMVTYVQKVSTAQRVQPLLKLVQGVHMVQAQEILKPLNANSVPLAPMAMILELLLASRVVVPHAPKLDQRVVSALV
jgi:hypothetical protein